MTFSTRELFTTLSASYSLRFAARTAQRDWHRQISLAAPDLLSLRKKIASVGQFVPKIPIAGPTSARHFGQTGLMGIDVIVKESFSRRSPHVIHGSSEPSRYPLLLFKRCCRENLVAA